MRMLAIVVATSVLMNGLARAQEESKVDRLMPKGPAPRFIVVVKTDVAKGEVVFWVQVVRIGPMDQPSLLVDREGNQRTTLGHKPNFTIPIEGFRVPLAKGKWSTADGKEVTANAVAARLKPGTLVLLTADGKPVNETYLRSFKDDTLVLVVPVEDLPIPYMPQIGGSIPIKNVDRL
jgi:hypothetical protein